LKENRALLEKRREIVERLEREKEVLVQETTKLHDRENALQLTIAKNYMQIP